ncbi:MAG: GNAT family N-acetyltransferase [Pseudomonadota bacterium]|nr:GNAT family N-acetyltransferase [Pseudomonadota bacterium]
MSDDTGIRVAAPSDAPAVGRLLYRLKRQYGSTTITDEADFVRGAMSSVLEAIASTSNVVLVAEFSEEVVAFVDFSIRIAPRAGGRIGALEEIYVEGGWRRRGLGSALWSAGRDALRAKGVLEIEVITSMAHPGQRQFFATATKLEWYAAVHRERL